MKKLLFAALLTALTLNVSAQTYPPKDTPQLEFALQLRVTLGEAFGIDNTQHGRRTVIPITGGTFEGPLLKGTIINGGADYQLNAGDRTELEAIYCIKTDDGVYIHVRNRGIIASGRPMPRLCSSGETWKKGVKMRSASAAGSPRVDTGIQGHRAERLEGEISLRDRYCRRFP